MKDLVDCVSTGINAGDSGGGSAEGLAPGALVAPSLRAFIDESSMKRNEEQQEYLMCAVLLPVEVCADVREALRPLAKGRKLHWTAEGGPRRLEIVDAIADLGTMSCVVSHLGARTNKTERYRRLCLESIYHELAGMDVFDLLFEARGRAQDDRDRTHIVALQGSWLDRRVRIAHARGGDEPLLWIADAVLGAVNASGKGEPQYLDKLSETILINQRTPTSEALQSSA